MPDPKILLFQRDGHDIFLQGSVETGELVLHLPNDERFDLADPLQVTGLLEAEGTDFRFKRGPVQVTLSAELLPVSGAFTVFGQQFNGAAFFAARLIIRLPAEADAAPAGPFITLEFCGKLELESGGASFTSETLCFQVTVENLFPSAELPGFGLTLPDVGWRLPSLQLPWAFPRFPARPFQLPSFSFGFPALPLRLSWKAIRPDLRADKLIIDVDHLRIEGKFGAAIEADLRVVIKDEALALSECFIRFHRAPTIQVPLSEWRFDDRCLLLQWNEAALNDWLRLLAPDLADAEAPDNAKLTLRLLWDGGELDELRLDWEAPGAERTLNLPGFEVVIPPVQFYSLVAHRELNDANELQWLTLLATVQAGAVLSAHSAFTLARKEVEDKRELQQDENRPKNDPLVTFTAKTQNAVSVALLRLPFSSGQHAQFFRQLEQPLSTFDFASPETLCLAANYHTVSLRGTDWTLALKVNESAKEFLLPFLKQAPTPDTSQAIQVVGLQPLKPEDIDFPNHQLHCKLDLRVLIGALKIETTVGLDFDWERFAFGVSDKTGIKFKLKEDKSTEFLGLKWRFEPDAEGILFVLVTQDGDYQLKQAEGAKIQVEFTRATKPDSPIIFAVSGFTLAPGGVSLTARVTDSPARLNGLETQFRFTEGALQIHDNRITDFSIAGSGPLPPALVGNAIADIALQFGERDGRLELLAGIAQLRGSKLLHCQGTRFQFAIDGIGLKFVNDGRYHLYFTLTGVARFAPFPGEDAGGPLAWLPAVELQLIECPLTGDASVIAKHIKFLVELPKKVTFDFLGCFKMELRGLGFLPQATMFSDPTSAMELAGQIKFSDAGGDVVSAEIQFHSLFVGLPAPGELLPQIYFRQLGVKIRAGEAFSLEGEVEYIKGQIEPGLEAKGFGGRGVVTIQGLPEMAAAFTFVRVSNDGGLTWVKAWFIYLEARKMSLRIPPFNIFLREVGLGFGYRYTLAMIKTADELDDPKMLIKALQRLSLTQGELSRRDQWRVDLEAPGHDPRWTVALRALIAQTSATQTPFAWDANKERELPCLFVMDAVIGLRSDLTFLMTARAWLNTNYNDFLTDKNGLRSKPLLSGFVLLSPRQRRLLAHFASNPGAEFGDHPPLLEIVKQAIRQSRFSATLLIEPNLIHYELGWPNQLRWGGKFGPLTLEYRGGMIFRLSTRELVIGQSFLARGALEISAEIDMSFLGARLSATAYVAYGARYIGVLGFDRPAERSALYGAIGIEIRVTVRVEFWIRIKLFFAKITLRFQFNFSINLTAFLEVGVTARNLLGVRGTATVALRIMGRSLHFNVRVGINDQAVDQAFRITSQYLKMGLEAEDVEAVPGAPADRQVGAGGPQGSTQPALNLGQPLAMAAGAAARPTRDAVFLNGEAGAAESSPVGAAPAEPSARLDEEPKASAGDLFEAPDYSIFSITLGDRGTYFMFLPSGEPLSGETKQLFYPVPPDNNVTPEKDFEWALGAPPAELRHFDPLRTGGEWFEPQWECNAGRCQYRWRVNWDHPVADGAARKIEESQIEPGKDIPFDDKDENLHLTIRTHLRQAYIVEEPNTEDPAQKIMNVTPVSDPDFLPADKDDIQDPRVHHSSGDAVEAAARGAAEQLEGSPYLKRDAQSYYENALQRAFDPGTTIYTSNGLITPDQEEKMIRLQQAVQFRSVVIHQLITDLQKYAQLVEAGAPDDKLLEFSRGSLPFQMGLVFKTPAPLDWFNSGAEAGVMRQRAKRSSPLPDSTRQGILRPFNTSQTSFHTNPPQFQRIKHQTDAGTVAIAWDLVWPESVTKNLKESQRDPEHHLQHYLVRRRSLDGREREAEFTLKNVEVLNRNEGGVLERLRARFQLVDHFNDKTAEDLAALPPEGRRYLYTITPVDVAGQRSERPLTIVALCRPNEPPPTPADGELIVSYQLRQRDFEPAPLAQPPQVQPPADVAVQWTPPGDTPRGPQVGIEEYRLIFRREDIFPIGSYGLDSESQGARTNGLPTSNARPLRTDIILSWDASPKNNPPVTDPVTRQKKLKHALELQELITKGVLPAEDAAWRPEAWRVFIQTRGFNGVLSALAPAQISLRFSNVEPTPGEGVQLRHLEERAPGLLEWLARPMRFAALPPEDGKAEAGEARVPMPLFLEKTGVMEIDAASQTIQCDTGGLDVFNPREVVIVTGAEQAQNNGRKRIKAVEPTRLTFEAGSFSANEAKKPLTLTLDLLPPLLQKTGAMRIDKASKTIQCPGGGLDVFNAQEVVVVAGAEESPNNGPKRIKTVEPTRLTFEDDPFSADEAERPLTLTLDQPIQSLNRRFGYNPHPERLRAIRFEWNQGPSAPDAYPVDLHAGYQIYEFDLDAHTAEILDNPSADGPALFDRMRRVQELEALSPANLRLSPPDNTAAHQWEAWYPSALRRRQLRDAAPQPPKRSEAPLSPWYSWRDSYLEWPEDQSLYDPEAPLTAPSMAGKMSLSVDKQQITKEEGGLNIFKPGQLLRVSGAVFEPHNGVKKLQAVDDKVLTFEAGSFPPRPDPNDPAASPHDPSSEELILTEWIPTKNVVIGTMSILNRKIIELKEGGFNRFSAGQFVRITGAKPGSNLEKPDSGPKKRGNNGLKQIKEATATTLTFATEAFDEDEKDVRLTVERKPVAAVEVVGAMGLDKDKQTIHKPDGGLRVFDAGQRIRLRDVSRQGVDQLDLIARVEAVSDTLLLLEPGSLPKTARSLLLSLQGNLCTLDHTRQTLTKLDGGLGAFEAGQYVRLENAADPRNNGIKRILEVTSDTELKFEVGSVTSTETDAPLTLDGAAFTARHPFLEKLLGDLATVTGATVAVNPLPAAKPGDLRALLNATSPRLDPYGWNALKRMGLAATFVLRDRRTGEPLSSQAILEALRLVAPSSHPLARHLHVEPLFQPAQNMRLPEEADLDIPSDALLAVTQLSLRPALRQVFGYVSFEVQGKGGEIVKLAINNQNRSCRLVEQTADQVTAPENLKASDKAIPRSIILPPSGRASLIFQRAKPKDAPELVVQRLKGNGQPEPDDKQPQPTYLSPTDWRAIYFSAPEDGWPLQLADVAGAEQVAVNWARFKRYLLRLNPPVPSNPDDPKIDLPKSTDSPEFKDVLDWLQRFFEAGGDVPPVVADTLAATGPGPWLAALYPRSLSPVGVTPNPAGQFKYYLPVEDQWAHVYRYYVLPAGRYDRLWQALAQSERLFPEAPPAPEQSVTPQPSAAAQRLNTLASLRPPDPEPIGGLDVALDRLRSIDAPLVLFSGRLDPPSAEAEVALPGKTWEVIVAKHPEQSLIERNRTLARQLAYRQMAHTLLRRFAFTPRLGELQTALLRDVTPQSFTLHDPIASSGDKLWLFVNDEDPLELDLAGRNHLAGLAEAINALNIQIPVNGQSEKTVKLIAEALPPPPKDGQQPPARHCLALSSTADARLELRARRDDAQSNLLLAKPKYQIDLRHVTTPARHALPEPYSAPGAPDHLDLSNLSADEARTLDLPLRLKTFSQGALVLQWEALPYFYEHRLLLVAQTTTNVSPLTELRQRDFEYISPTPQAEFDVLIDARADRRSLVARLALASFWDCLPPSARDRWRIEEPQEADGNRRKLASLPDTDVVYQLTLERDAGVVEAQAELFFDPQQPSGYQARQFANQLTVKSMKLLPPANNQDGRSPLRLEIAFEVANVSDNAISEEPVSSRATFAAVAGELGGRVSFPQPLACVLALTGRLTPAERTTLAEWGKEGDVSFASAVRRLLEQEAQVISDDETVFAEASVSFEQLTEICPADRLTLPTQTEPRLTWRGAIKQEQDETLARWAELSIFGRTFEQLRQESQTQTLTFDFTGDPPATLPTVLQNRLEVVTQQIKWKGLLLTPDEQSALETLKNDATLGSGFRDAVGALLIDLTDPSATAQAQVTVATPPGWRPRPALPDEFKTRLLIAQARLRFTGWLARTEAERLREASAGPEHPDRLAIARLYRASIQAGLVGGKLRLRARRGSAQSAPGDFSVDL
jgi:hypothetical protein